MENTCVSPTTQSMTDIVTAGMEQSYMELSMKLVPLIHLQITWMTMMPHVPCATSDHAVLNWWCLQEMIVHLVGLKSIMVIWWPLIMATRVHETSSVLTGRLSMFLAPNLIRMVRCCILYKEVAARYHAFHTSGAGSWHAQSVPNKRLGTRDSKSSTDVLLMCLFTQCYTVLSVNLY